ncbi:MAG TPA: zf-HC2 domain-containing protein [Gemmatimonadota bacterium]|nr:zf-HC2 domain-containing protein [Gemmatimonadota bacterium]
MNCADVRERLDGWVKETLGEEERAAVALHLETCEACRGEARGLETLLAAAAVLPREIMPPRDLWVGIDARLDRPEAVAPRAARGRPASGLPRWALVAAALALVVVTAAVASILTRRWDEAMALKLRPPGEEARFLAASQELLVGLEDQDLSPETMAIVRRNLEVIDAAIAELRVALERDPGNAELTRMLLATYQQKIELLEQAARSGEG